MELGIMNKHQAATIRLPVHIWKAIKTAIRDREIKSMQSLIVDLLTKHFKK